MEEERTAPDAFLDYLGSVLSGEGEDWTFQTTRVARDVHLEGRARIPTDIGANLFIDLGLDFENRDATTFAGSLLRSRSAFYDTMPGIAYSRMQLEEFQKDGLLSSTGRVDEDTFLLVLGKMREEVLATYGNPTQTARAHLSPDEFQRNLDGSRSSSRHAQAIVLLRNCWKASARNARSILPRETGFGNGL